ncbi:MAG: hypothetical protein NUV53_04805 [Patescibacteria group bacterium]|nr:hypothetical protein [Patescibacteria group bacterium]
MHFALVYIVQRAFFRIADFFHHWYGDGSRVVFHNFISMLERLDRKFAVKVTLRYFFEPLYQDYSAVGRVLGVLFRTIRVSVGLAVYAATAIFYAIIFAAWCATPAVLLFYVFTGF